MKVLLVDDEPLALDLLEAILKDNSDVDVLAKCSNGFEAVKCVLEHTPDILFLDIEMPEMSGFDVIRSIQADILPKVIFTTAYSHYAVEAFKVQALNYVLKPLDDQKIGDCIERAKQALEKPQNQNNKTKMLTVMDDLNSTQALSPSVSRKALIVKDSDKMSFLDKSLLKWVEADGDYVCIHMQDTTHLIRATLKSIEAELSDINFQRIHRSTIINLDMVKEIIPAKKGEAIVVMVTGQHLKVSRNYGADLRKKLA